MKHRMAAALLGLLASACASTEPRPASAPPPAYVIAEIAVTEPTGYGDYLAAISPIVERFGGTYLVRGGSLPARTRDPGVKILVGSASAFKKILRETAAEAKLLGDYSQYSRVSYQASRGMVRVDATRTSTLRKYPSPAVFPVGKCANGEIGIVEVVFHSKPDR